MSEMLKTDEELRSKIEELDDRTDGAVENREAVEFSEIRDLLLAVGERETTDLADEVDFRVLEDISAKQVEGATTSEYVSLMREVDSTCLNLTPLAAANVVVSDEEGSVEVLVEALEERNEPSLESVLSMVCHGRPGVLVGADDVGRLLDSDAEAVRDAVAHVSIEHPDEMKRVTPEFFERFERGRHRILFVNFVAELCRTDPEYAEEWVRKTIAELDDEDLEKAPGRRGTRTVEECVRTMARWCPAVFEGVGATDRVLRIAAQEAGGWRKDSWKGKGYTLSASVRLEPEEYARILNVAEENGDTFREAVEKGLGMYAEAGAVQGGEDD